MPEQISPAAGPGDRRGADLPLLSADLGTGIRAAFTTRTGGVSAGAWAELNLGLHVQDDPADVLANRGLLDRWAGVPVTYASQVHGTGVAVVLGPPSPGQASIGTYDAMVSATPGVALAVLVADCVPLLLADPRERVVAVVHVGRQGLVDAVVARAVEAMVGLGARPEQTRAVIGPAVCGDCYEVPAPLQAAVEAAVPGTATTTSWGTPAVDIPAGVGRQLADAGIGYVAASGLCTMTDRRFYSHRRDGSPSPTGRFVGVVHLPAL